MPGVGLTATLSSNGLDMNPALAMMKATQCFENLAFSSKPTEAESNLMNKGLMEKNVTEKGFLEKNLVMATDSSKEETAPLKQQDDSGSEDRLDDEGEDKGGELQSLMSSS